MLDRPGGIGQSLARWHRESLSSRVAHGEHRPRLLSRPDCLTLLTPTSSRDTKVHHLAMYARECASIYRAWYFIHGIVINNSLPIIHYEIHDPGENVRSYNIRARARVRLNETIIIGSSPCCSLQSFKAILVDS